MFLFYYMNTFIKGAFVRLTICLALMTFAVSVDAPPDRDEPFVINVGDGAMRLLVTNIAVAVVHDYKVEDGDPLASTYLDVDDRSELPNMETGWRGWNAAYMLRELLGGMGFQADAPPGAEESVLDQTPYILVANDTQRDTWKILSDLPDGEVEAFLRNGRPETIEVHGRVYIKVHQIFIMPRDNVRRIEGGDLRVLPYEDQDVGQTGHIT